MTAVNVLSTKTSNLMEVQEVTDRTTFIGLETEWNTLVKATTQEPFYRHEFIRTWIDNFAPKSQLKVLTGRNQEGRLIAALPLMAEYVSMYGLPVKQLVSTCNTHSCRFDMVAEDGEVAGQQFFTHLASDKSWDVLKIMDVPEGGNAWQIYKTAEAASFPLGHWESQRSPYLTFPSSYDELMGRVSSQLPINIRRCRRKLEKKGKVSIERITGGEELGRYLEEGFALEQNGWKGRLGTAIAQDPDIDSFYTNLGGEAADRNYLSLFILKLDNKPIAFNYGLTYDDICYMLKITYDEAYRDCSPGLVLLGEVFKDCTDRHLKGYDFLGAEAEWKLKWTDTVRPHNWLFIFRKSGLGHALHKAKFQLIPVAKQLQERWRELWKK